jgi:peptidyl-prolyl cis-trans isomerase C
MTILFKKLFVLICVSLLFSAVSAQTKANVSGITSIGSVNGKEIDAKNFEQIIKNNVANGLEDTEQLRAAVKEELITRQVMLQEVSRLGLDKTPEAVYGVNFVKDNFLIDYLLKSYEAKHSITDEMIKSEYDRQLVLIGEPSEAMQYLVRAIVTQTEADARSVISDLKKGSDFLQLAKSKSIDPSKTNGGDLGWVLPAQVMPALGNVMVNLKPGSYSALPIQTPNGWYVLRVEDKRPFKIPTFEESKATLIQTLQQVQRQNYVRELIKAAKITK